MGNLSLLQCGGLGIHTRRGLRTISPIPYISNHLLRQRGIAKLLMLGGGWGGMDKVILVTNILKNPTNSLGSFACKAKISLAGRRKKTKNVKIDWLMDFCCLQYRKVQQILTKTAGTTRMLGQSEGCAEGHRAWRPLSGNKTGNSELIIVDLGTIPGLGNPCSHSTH